MASGDTSFSIMTDEFSNMTDKQKCEIVQDSFDYGFHDMPEGCCRETPVEPFTLDLHLFGLECNQEIPFFVIVIAVTIFIKCLQIYLGTKMGQLERELMQIDAKERRKLRGNECWCMSKFTRLLISEFLAGVIGVVSILVITGNNFWIWLTVVMTNTFAVGASLWLVKPDHHSPAAELKALLDNANSAIKKNNKERSSEETAALQALQQLNSLINDNKLQDLASENLIDNTNSIMPITNLRQRLIL